MSDNTIQGQETAVQQPVSIIFAEDHHVVRNGITAILQSQTDLKVIAQAANGLQVLELLKQGVKADIILTDVNMPGIDGIELTKQVKAMHPEVKVIILTMLDSNKFISKAFKTGANGYVLKSTSQQELIFAIRHVAERGNYVCSEIAMRMVDRMISAPEIAATGDVSDLNLADRDLETLALIAEGYTNVEIADMLFTSKRTVEGYRQSLMNKTGSRNTAALIKFALKNGLLN